MLRGPRRHRRSRRPRRPRPTPRRAASTARRDRRPLTPPDSETIPKLGIAFPRNACAGTFRATQDLVASSVLRTDRVSNLRISAPLRLSAPLCHTLRQGPLWMSQKPLTPTQALPIRTPVPWLRYVGSFRPRQRHHVPKNHLRPWSMLGHVPPPRANVKRGHHLLRATRKNPSSTKRHALPPRADPSH